MKLRAAGPLILITALASTGCSLLSSGSSETVAGTWASAPIPSGGQTLLTLVTVGDSVTGTDHEYGLGHVPGDSATISGRLSNGIYTLKIEYSRNGVASFSGRLVDAGTLEGTWTVPPPEHAMSTSVTFFRQPE